MDFLIGLALIFIGLVLLGRNHWVERAISADLNALVVYPIGFLVVAVGLCTIGLGIFALVVLVVLFLDLTRNGENKFEHNRSGLLRGTGRYVERTFLRT